VPSLSAMRSNLDNFLAFGVTRMILSVTDKRLQ
jgi:hypothetical protein